MYGFCCSLINVRVIITGNVAHVASSGACSDGWCFRMLLKNVKIQNSSCDPRLPLNSFDSREKSSRCKKHQTTLLGMPTWRREKWRFGDCSLSSDTH